MRRYNYDRAKPGRCGHPWCPNHKFNRCRARARRVVKAALRSEDERNF